MAPVSLAVDDAQDFDDSLWYDWYGYCECEPDCTEPRLIIESRVIVFANNVTYADEVNYAATGAEESCNPHYLVQIGVDGPPRITTRTHTVYTPNGSPLTCTITIRTYTYIFRCSTCSNIFYGDISDENHSLGSTFH